MKIIDLEKISKTYQHGPRIIKALTDISLSIHKGEFVAIMGPSGSGKSTLLNIIGCLDMPTSGAYIFEDKKISNLSEKELSGIRNRKMGFIFQSYYLLPSLDILHNAVLPMVYAGKKHNEMRSTGIETLTSVGLLERLNHKPQELSGGEQQKVAIARALVNKPDLIIADEPTGNLDSESGREILSILTDLNRSGVTVILVTHDSNVAAYAKRIIRLRDGRMVGDSSVSNSA